MKSNQVQTQDATIIATKNITLKNVALKRQEILNIFTELKAYKKATNASAGQPSILAPIDWTKKLLEVFNSKEDDEICKFFQQEEVIEIFKKYKGVDIIGNCLWDFDVTWDMDLRLYVSYSEPNDWDSIEADINKLNYLALNEWRILPDIGISTRRHNLPTKSQILSSEYDEERGEYKVNLSENVLYKISYVKKVVDDKIFENDIRNSIYYYTEPMTNGYLIAYYPKYHTKKITDKILNSKIKFLVDLKKDL